MDEGLAEFLFYGVLGPGVLGLSAGLLCWGLLGRRDCDRRLDWVAPIAMLLGGALALRAPGEIPLELWPTNAPDRKLLILLIAFAAGTGDALAPKAALRWVSRFVCGGAAVWVTLSSLPVESMPASRLLAWIAGAGVVVAVGAAGFERLARRGGWASPAALGLMVAVSAVMAVFSKATPSMHIIGGLAAVIGGLGVASLLVTGLSLASGAGAMAMTFVVGTLGLAHAYAFEPTPIVAVLLVVLAPAVAGVLVRRTDGERRLSRSAGLVLAAGAVMACGALWAAAVDFGWFAGEEPEDDGGVYYYDE